MKTFTEQEYKAFDKTLKYRAEKELAVIAYNHYNGTKYKYISEYMHKLAEQKQTAREISEPLDVTKTAVSYMLRKMGVKPLSTGGPNYITFLSKSDLVRIRASKKKYRVLAEEHGVSIPTIYKIIHREGRWAKE